MKKVIRAAVSVLSVIIILIAVVLMLNAVSTRPGKVPSIFGYSMLRVVTGSMEPELPVDSLVIVRSTSPDEIEIGDIISYYSKDPELDGAVNTHRVVAVTPENGSVIFTTRGDNNYLDDEYTVNGQDVIGVTVASSAIAGKLLRLLSNPLVFFPAVILPLLIIIIANIIKAIRSTREIIKEEEKAAVLEIAEELKRREADAGKANGSRRE